ncbi:MAG: response regulator, partial [Victivallaceae bacterium]
MEEIKRGEILPVLIVEDNHEDYESILRVFKKLGIANALYRCENGTDALDFIHQRNSYGTDAKAPRPGIVLLDLNLPGTDGREVLKEIKADPHLKSIPVVVLTTSDSDRDISECYLNGANSY